MIKKLLFIFLLCISTIGFSQKKSITKLTAVPNPFTSSTKITFTTKEKETAIFIVKNILGKLVHTQQIKAVEGQNSIVFYRKKLSPGIYIYTIKNKNSIVSKRLIIK